MAQVKTESKEIFLALSLQLCEPMNLLKKERMLLGCTSVLVMTSEVDLPEKQASQQNNVRPWIDWRWPAMLLLL